jgi:hypothetical protein
MSNNVVPVTFETRLHTAMPAKCSFHVETKDQYTAKYISLFLVNLEITFSVIKLGDEWVFSFQVPEETAPGAERFLSTLSGSRPSTEQLVKPHLYVDADAGRLDLAHSQHAVAQVAGHGNTEYLADIWNAFMPGSQAEAVINTAPIPALPLSVR